MLASYVFHGKLKCKDKKILQVFMAFIYWGIFSVLLYNALFYQYTFRQFASILYMVQFAFLFIGTDFDKENYCKWHLLFSIVLCTYIYGIFISNGYHKSYIYLTGQVRNWGEGYLSGFPSAQAVPLVFAVFLCFRMKKNIAIKFYVTVAAILIPSRVCQVATALVWCYFMIKSKKKWKAVCFGTVAAVGLLLCNYGMVLTFLTEFVPKFMYRYQWERNGDRFDIFRQCLIYFLKSPFIGYGGNTLDTVPGIVGNVSKYHIVFPHAHNWFLEMVIRYGVVGCGLFTVFHLMVFRRIFTKDNRWMYAICILMALTQTYMQDFNFLILLMVLSETNGRQATQKENVIKMYLPEWKSKDFSLDGGSPDGMVL